MYVYVCTECMLLLYLCMCIYNIYVSCIRRPTCDAYVNGAYIRMYVYTLYICLTLCIYYMYACMYLCIYARVLCMFVRVHAWPMYVCTYVLRRYDVYVYRYVGETGAG